MAVEAVRYKFNVDDYHRMVDSGIFTEDSRVELIDGHILDMGPIGSRHAQCVNRLNKALVLAAGDDAIVSVQNPVRLSDLSEPQPDLMLLRQRDYSDQLPGPDDVLLLIEVADTNLTYDQGPKLALYARTAIPQLLIIDLQGRTVWRSTEPSGNAYRHLDRYDAGDLVTLKPLSDLAIEFTVDDIMS
jgi:Uma2 family endonuclease